MIVDYGLAFELPVVGLARHEFNRHQADGNSAALLKQAELCFAGARSLAGKDHHKREELYLRIVGARAQSVASRWTGEADGERAAAEELDRVVDEIKALKPRDPAFEANAEETAGNGWVRLGQHEGSADAIDGAIKHLDTAWRTLLSLRGIQESLGEPRGEIAKALASVLRDRGDAYISAMLFALERHKIDGKAIRDLSEAVGIFAGRRSDRAEAAAARSSLVVACVAQANHLAQGHPRVKEYEWTTRGLRRKAVTHLKRLREEWMSEERRAGRWNRTSSNAAFSLSWLGDALNDRRFLVAAIGWFGIARRRYSIEHQPFRRAVNDQGLADTLVVLSGHRSSGQGKTLDLKAARALYLMADAVFTGVGNFRAEQCRGGVERCEYQLSQLAATDSDLTPSAESCDGYLDQLEAEEGLLCENDIPPEIPDIGADFASATLDELVEEFVREAPDELIGRVEAILIAAQEKPPEDREHFVTQMNRLLQAQNLRVSIPGKGLARMALRGQTIQFRVPGIGGTAFARRQNIRVVRVEEEYGRRGHKSAEPK